MHPPVFKHRYFGIYSKLILRCLTAPWSLTHQSENSVNLRVLKKMHRGNVSPQPRNPHRKKKRGEPKTPTTPKEARGDEERLRNESCALCTNFKRLSRKDLRHKRIGEFNLEKNAALLQKMQDIFPEFSTNKRGIPVAYMQQTLGQFQNAQTRQEQLE